MAPPPPPPPTSQPGAGRAIQFESDATAGETLLQLAQLDLDDAVHVRTGQPIKDDGLIKTVEEFGPEMRPYRIHDIPLCRAGICTVGQLAERLRPEVRRQNDQGLFEINRPAFTIG